MTNYDELVKALRCENTGDDECGSSDCPYWSGLGCMDGQLMGDAADAIEALQKDITTLQKCYEIADTTVDKVLKQLPKRGKWIGVNPMVDTVQCSICGGQLFSAELETPYCPYCGAKMTEVQE